MTKERRRKGREEKGWEGYQTEERNKDGMTEERK